MFPLISGGVKDPMQTALIDPIVVNIPGYQHCPTSYPRGRGKWPKMGLQRQGWADLPGFYTLFLQLSPPSPSQLPAPTSFSSWHWWKQVEERLLAAACVTLRQAYLLPIREPRPGFLRDGQEAHWNVTHHHFVIAGGVLTPSVCWFLLWSSFLPQIFWVHQCQPFENT